MFGSVDFELHMPVYLNNENLAFSRGEAMWNPPMAGQPAVSLKWLRERKFRLLAIPISKSYDWGCVPNDDYIKIAINRYSRLCCVLVIDEIAIRYRSWEDSKQILLCCAAIDVCNNNIVFFGSA